MADRSNSYGIRQLRQDILDDPNLGGKADYASGIVPAVAYTNRELADILRNDPEFRSTNIGANPAAYLDPRYSTHLTRTATQGAEGQFYPQGSKGRKNMRLWANANNIPEEFLDSIAHENTHGNTMDRLNYDPSNHDRPGVSPYLHDELMVAYQKAFPEHAKDNIGYGMSQGNWTEPAAWANAREALLPSGQMPIQEAMNRKGLGALYAHMTTAGPVATRWEPSMAEKLKAYMTDPDEERIQMYGPSGMRRLRNYVESGFSSNEPYELRGNEVEKARSRK